MTEVNISEFSRAYENYVKDKKITSIPTPYEQFINSLATLKEFQAEGFIVYVIRQDETKMYAIDRHVVSIDGKIVLPEYLNDYI